MKKLILSFAVGFRIIAGSCSNSVSPNFSEGVSFELSARIAPGYFISAIALDNKNSAWLGTGDGVCVLRQNQMIDKRRTHLLVNQE